MTAVLPAAEPTRPGTRASTPPRRRTTERATLLGLLAATALLYLWGLGESGWANSFYAAAAQAGSESWKAFFYGSSDAASSITVDKTPLSLWPMALSIRVFGLSSWSLLVPQALEGVAAVALLHATVKRATGSHLAGLLAGAVLALTPVAVLMFRFDNPDALLVLLMIGAVHATLRATESPRAVRWLVLGGGLVGLAYLTKMLQAFLVLPALALTYLLFAPATVTAGRRILHLLGAFGAMIAAAGWWIAIVELVPASMRPWIGGSQGNSILELTLGYNGLGRLSGNETGSVGGGRGGGTSMWGSTGLFRLFDSENGAQGSWLLPAALLLATATLALAVPRVARMLHLAPLPRRTAAAATVWAGWLAVTWLTFSFMAGIFHAYYAVALAPAVAASVAIGAHVLWTRRDHLVASGLLAATTALSSVWAFELLGRTDWQPWLRWVVLVGGIGSALALGAVRLAGRWAPVVAAVAIAAVLAGPSAYSLSTAATPHTGSIPTAGPEGAGGAGGPGGAMRGRMGTPPGVPGAGPTGQGGPTGQQGMPFPGATEGGGMGGAAGGLLNSSTPSTALTRLLLADADQYTWVAAAVGSNSASGYQLATEKPVMPIGGFNGSDPSPTLAAFKQLVADGEVHWFIAGGMGTGAGSQTGGSTASSQIASWVSSTFAATTVDGVTLYDLTQAAS
ncbi:glycosyltransferase family 39 protein [Nocardioides jiangxiensis]|uniref:Glycosyltransferase family 39 protein n=1 Tax=Nocardioides jiangxiensis TaxID=3064524 RepID=A0ABT9B1L5_9ACTN|nr:glycosyltransferase family 39 protein [Nocardioides sp. WY-20]MDO7868745.1 glycosyltransferase family 39 protein [Nocardioides sp. WY-20]